MTQRRNDPDRLSNYFDGLLRGIGHRGSSFTDVDALTHDERTDRYLFQEFKREDEPLNRAQWRAFTGLARKDYITVWCVRKRKDGRLDWCDVAMRSKETISIEDYRRRFKCWWDDIPIASVGVNGSEPPVILGEMSDEDMKAIWGDGL